MNLVDRVKKILLQPRSEWAAISTETTSTADLYKGYVVPLAAIGPIASVLGLSVFGMSVPFAGTVRVPISNALAHGITSYALALVGVFLIALIIDALAPTFGGEKDASQALKVSVYASTPSWVAGVFLLLPTLGILSLLAGFYGLYLLYLGLPALMKAPQEKALGYTAVVVIAAAVLTVVFGALSGLFMPAAHMGPLSVTQ